MSDDIERRLTVLEGAYTVLAKDVSRHLGGCEKWTENVNVTLKRFEKTIESIKLDLNRRAFAVIAAQAAIGLTLFTAWLAVRHAT